MPIWPSRSRARRAGAGERGERRDTAAGGCLGRNPLRVSRPSSTAFSALIIFAFAASGIGSRLRGGQRQDIGGQRFGRPFGSWLVGPVTQQPVVIEIGRHLAGERLPAPDIAQRQSRATAAVRSNYRDRPPYSRARPTAAGRACPRARHRHSRPGSAPAGIAISKLRVGTDAEQAGRPGFDRHRGLDRLREDQPVALPCRPSPPPRPSIRSGRRCRGAVIDQLIGTAPPAGMVTVNGSPVAIGGRQRRGRGDRHRLVGAVAQREARVISVAGADEFGQPGEDRKVLHGAHAGLSGAEHIASRRSRSRRGWKPDRVSDSGTSTVARPLASSGTLPFHSSTGWKSSRSSPDRSPPPPPPGSTRLAAVMALADDLHLRGRGQHRRAGVRPSSRRARPSCRWARAGAAPRRPRRRRRRRSSAACRPGS